MSHLKPSSPSVRPQPQSHINSSPRNNSRNLTPPPPPQKRYRSTSPLLSPPRKYSRRSPTPSRSPSNHPYNSTRSSHPYRPYHPYHRSDQLDTHNRYPDRDRVHHRHQDGRRRYYSPQPRSPPSRYRPISPHPYPLRHPHTSREYNPYRSVFRDDAYRDRHYHPPRLRMSHRSSSRSPRRRRDRQRRDRRRRDRQPVSPSQIMPAENVDKLFLEALKLVVRYRPPPFNISVISDYMTSINPKWSVRNTQYPTFSHLCRLQESSGHLVLARQGESVVMQSSKYQPDVLEVRPKDITRRKRNHDRHEHDPIHVDRTDRREWNLDERAKARKERFRVNGDKKNMPINSNQQANSSKENDLGEGATEAVPEKSFNGAERNNVAPIDEATDPTERSQNANLNGPGATGATAASDIPQDDSVQPNSTRTAREVCNGIDRSGNAETVITTTKLADRNGLKSGPMNSREKGEEITTPDVSEKKVHDRTDKDEEKGRHAENNTESGNRFLS